METTNKLKKGAKKSVYGVNFGVKQEYDDSYHNYTPFRSQKCNWQQKDLWTEAYNKALLKDAALKD